MSIVLGKLKDLLVKYGHWVELFLALIFIILVFAAGWSYAHKDTILAEEKLKNALDANTQKDAVLKDCNDATIEAQRQELAAKEREAIASKALAELKVKGAKTVTIFVDKQNNLEQKAECAVLKEHICPAAMDY